MKDERVVDSLSRVTLSAGQKEALLDRILLSADARRANAREELSMKHSHTKSLRWLVPVAAAAAVVVLVFCIPSVSRAVSNWLDRIFHPINYLGTMPENRDPEPAVEAAIQTPDAQSQQSAILLLEDTDEYADFTKARADYSLPAYVPADWTWLKAVQPELREVLYDDGLLYVTSFLKTDPLPFYQEVDGLRLDWVADSATLRPAGTDTDLPLQMDGTGIWPQPGYYTADGVLDEAAVAADGGVYLLSTYAVDPALLSGDYVLTQVTRILDVYVDPMANLATVAKITQSAPVALDTSAAPAASAAAIPLAGVYPLSVEASGDPRQAYNTTADLSEVSVAATVAPHTTGIRVALRFTFPESWTPEMRFALLGGQLHKWNGLRYLLLVDGEEVEALSFGEGSLFQDGLVVLEIPLAADAQADASTIVLRPVYGFSTKLIVNGEAVSDLSTPYAFGAADGVQWWDTENASVTLSGCDIPILP